MSLRDFSEPSQPLHTDPTGNGTGLGSFHTVNPEDREPSNMPQIVGALAVVLMVGAAGIGLYAYSGSSTQPKPVVADNSLPQPPAQAGAPIAPPPAPPALQADNTPTPAADTAPVPAPTKEASVKAIRHHKVARASDDSSSSSTSTADNSANANSSQMASSAAQTRMSADSTQATTQAPAHQAVTAPSSATPLPAAPQPSPSDVASNNAQATQPVQSATPTPEQGNAGQQQPAQQQPVQQTPAQQAPVEQSGAAQAPAQ